MKATAAAQALVMVLALLACFTPAMSMRSLKGGCDCDAYFNNARIEGFDKDKGCWQVNQENCGTCGLGTLSLIKAVLQITPVVCVNANVNVLPCGCKWTWEQMADRDCAGWRDGACACTCTADLVDVNASICLYLGGLLGGLLKK